MKTEISTEASEALTDLASAWPNLKKDLDKAIAIERVAKLSARVLAKHLGCSETQIRNYRLMAKASSDDQLLASKGEISSRELVRRSRRAEEEHKAAENEALSQNREKAAQRACREICDWLSEENLWPSHCENIIDEARRILDGVERNRTLPRGAFPPGTPLNEIIKRSEPKPQPEAIEVARYALWLARWSFHAFPDSIVRDRALNLALNEQIAKI